MFRFSLPYFFTSVFLLSYFNAASQGTALCPPGSKKAVKLLDEAKAAKKSKEDYKTVRELLTDVTEEDTAFAEPWLVLGDLAYVKKDYVTMKKA